MTTACKRGTLEGCGDYTWNTCDMLGYGATAEVYLARHSTTGKKVAVKVYTGTVNFKEIVLLRQCRNPHIVRCIEADVFINKDNARLTCLIMEYCQESLQAVLDRPCNAFGLQERDLLRVVHDVTSGVKYLFNLNIVHRDIKPANIMKNVDFRGSTMYKITDLGQAKKLEDDETEYQSLCGTVEYCHPTTYGPTHHVRTDLWSIGVTFSHSATGTLPFRPFVSPDAERASLRTMYTMLQQKPPGAISGVQEDEKDGMITWAKKLPVETTLSRGIAFKMEKLLTMLMETVVSKMPPFPDYFSAAFDLCRPEGTTLVFNVFGAEHLRVRTAAELHELTGIHPCGQLLLHRTGARAALLEDTVTTADDDTVYLYDAACQQQLNIGYDDIRLDFLPGGGQMVCLVEEDCELASKCCNAAHLYKHKICALHSRHQHMKIGMTVLRSYTQTRLTLIRERLACTMRRIEEAADRFSSSSSSIVETIDNAKVRIAASEHALTGIDDTITATSAAADTIPSCYNQEDCREQHESLIAIIEKIWSVFKMHKREKAQMTEHDEKIHRFQKEEMAKSIRQLYFMLTDHVEHLQQQHAIYGRVRGLLIDFIERMNEVETRLEAMNLHLSQVSQAALNTSATYDIFVLGDRLREVLRLAKENTSIMN